MAKSSQPSSGAFEYSNEWSHGLLSCCEDCGSFIKALICMHCTLCELNEAAGECKFTSCCCGLLGLVALRNKIRGHHKIRGDIYMDICTLQFCSFCAILQMKKELESH